MERIQKIRDKTFYTTITLIRMNTSKLGTPVAVSQFSPTSARASSVVRPVLVHLIAISPQLRISKKRATLKHTTFTQHKIVLLMNHIVKLLRRIITP